MPRFRFDGHIAAFGTASGVRVVLGLWATSPFGHVADAMVETADGRRILIAPSDALADFIAATYNFDEIRVEPTSDAGECDDAVAFASESLTVRARRAHRTLVGTMLLLVPPPVARSAVWCRAINPLASRLRPGVSTYGTARGGRREWYGAYDEHAIDVIDVSWQGRSLGAQADIDPPVHFGFGSSPRRPSVVRLTSTVSTRA